LGGLEADVTVMMAWRGESQLGPLLGGNLRRVRGFVSTRRLSPPHLCWLFRESIASPARVKFV